MLAASVLWGITGTAATFAPAVGPLAIGAAAMGLGGLLQALTAARPMARQRTVRPSISEPRLFRSRSPCHGAYGGTDESGGAGQSELTTDPTGVRRRQEAAMLYQRNAYDIVSQQRKAMLAEAAAIARASAARRAVRGSRSGSTPALMSRVRASFRLRAA